MHIISYIIQAILWVLFIGAPLFSNPDRFSDPGFLTQYILKQAMYLLLFYGNYFLFIPRILKQNGITVYVFLSLAAMTIAFILSNLIESIFIRPPGMRFFLFFDIVPIIQVYAVSISFRLLIDHLTQLATQKKLEEQNKLAELNFLRSQINPHFLFNTLNNINALVRLRPVEAEKAIGTLSELMRYVLGSSKIEKAELRKETEYLGNYIELQRLRLPGDFKLNYECAVENDQLEIEPLLLIGFIENTFKHGVSGNATDFINVRIHEQNGRLKMLCENRINKHANVEKITSGVGLENTKKRLDICYKDKYVLQLSTDNDIYKIYLEIGL